MKRIGILTYHRYYNYGTALQAYALQNYISRNFKHNVEIIDYIPKNEYVGKKLISTRIKRIGICIKNISKYYTLYKFQNQNSIRTYAFEDFFKNHLVMSSEFTDSVEGLQKLCSQYDAVMIGSDQTWNPFLDSKKRGFLLEYLDNISVSKLSYGPSIGVSKLPTEYIEDYIFALSQFKFLSCREYEGAKSLSVLLNRKVEFVLDPTLLLTSKEWDDVAKPVEVDKPYLLTYFLGDNKLHREIAEKIALEKKLQIVAIPVSYLEMKNPTIYKKFVGPCEFISLIKNASYICTDSFHGTMFSINYKKDFLTFPKRKDNEINSDNNRLYDFLKVLNLEERIVCSDEPCMTSIDYKLVADKLDPLRLKSFDYLKRSLQEI